MDRLFCHLIVFGHTHHWRVVVLEQTFDISVESLEAEDLKGLHWTGPPQLLNDMVKLMKGYCGLYHWKQPLVIGRILDELGQYGA